MQKLPKLKNFHLLLGLVLVGTLLAGYALGATSYHTRSAANTMGSDHMNMDHGSSHAGMDHGSYMDPSVRQAYEEGGVEKAIEQIKLTAGDAPSILDCHMAMHHLGMMAYDSSKDINVALSKLGTYCWSGYLHGAIEEYFLDLDAASLPTAAAHICDAVKDREIPVQRECFHGIGHALMFAYENDIFASLKVCDTLPADMKAADNCYYGVFMENAYEHAGNYEGPPKKFIKADDTLYPCTEVAERHKQRCYRLSGFAFLYQTATNQDTLVRFLQPDDFKDAFAVCQRIDNRDYKNWCIREISVFIQGVYPRDFFVVRSLCDLLENHDQRDICYTASAIFIEKYDTSNKGLAAQFCAGSREEHRTSCYAAVEHAVDGYDLDADKRW